MTFWSRCHGDLRDERSVSSLRVPEQLASLEFVGDIIGEKMVVECLIAYL